MKKYDHCLSTHMLVVADIQNRGPFNFKWRVDSVDVKNKKWNEREGIEKAVFCCVENKRERGTQARTVIAGGCVSIRMIEASG